VSVGADFASHFRVSLAAVAIVLVATVEASAADAPPRTGAQVWAAACTACHADDGAGQSVTVVGFDVPLPNLRDCMFATSEATADWFAVVHEGGPVRGLSQMMPAFGGALRDQEIVLVIDYLRGFCRAQPHTPRGEQRYALTR
jgi:mono/diheme cytochrome c family protein